MKLLLALAVASPILAVPPPAQEADRAELERRFVELLTNARLVGHYTADDAPLDAAPQEESYAIRGVEKAEDGAWRVTALIEFAKGSFPIEILVDVDWAGDTPMILVRDREIPLLGTYSARVLFHEGRYAGTWQGGDHGGHLFGRVERDALPPAEKDAEQQGAAEGVHWPSFRGPNASGVAKGYPTVAEWDLESGENVLWRVPVPGLAHSSPVVWGDRVFLTTAVKRGEPAELKVGLYGSVMPIGDEGEHEFQVLCLDRRTGERVWSRTAHVGVPEIQRHPKGSHAASTPATDGEHVAAFFGSEGLYVYDVEGELLWSKDLGTLDSGFFMMPDAQWGFASSPVIHDGAVIVQCDVQEGSFLAAFDVATGEELWRTAREEVPTWGTPTVDARAGRVLVNGYEHMGAYDLETGEEIWSMAGGGDIPVPTPVLAHDLVYLTNAHGRMAPIVAVSASAEGELSLGEEDEHVAWSYDRRGNYMQTPIVVGDLLYLCSDGGVVRCYDARTGEDVYQERLGGGTTGFTSSPVYADGKLYWASEAGEVHVVRAGPEFELLAVNDLGETCMATPAISEGVLLYRTRGHLVAIGRR